MTSSTCNKSTSDCSHLTVSGYVRTSRCGTYIQLRLGSSVRSSCIDRHFTMQADQRRRSGESMLQISARATVRYDSRCKSRSIKMTRRTCSWSRDVSIAPPCTLYYYRFSTCFVHVDVWRPRGTQNGGKLLTLSERDHDCISIVSVYRTSSSSNCKDRQVIADTNHDLIGENAKVGQVIHRFMLDGVRIPVLP
jgi:hypothetical protein